MHEIVFGNVMFEARFGNVMYEVGFKLSECIFAAEVDECTSSNRLIFNLQ